MTIYSCIVSIIYNLCSLKYEKLNLKIEKRKPMDPYITILRCKMILSCEKYSKLEFLFYFDLFPRIFRRIFSTENRENNWRKKIGRRFRWRRWSFIFRSGMENKVRASRNGILSERLRSYVTRWIRYCEFSSSKLLRWKW